MGQFVISGAGAGAAALDEGGNARGAGSVDLQVERAGIGVTGVASGANSALVGGTDNIASAVASGCFAGDTNDAITGANATVVGGQNNTSSGVDAFIGGGQDHTASGAQAACVGGDGNTASAVDGFTGGGNANLNAGTSSAMIGGQSNSIALNSSYTAMMGGANNDTVNAADWSGIVGGQYASVTQEAGVVLGGRSGLADHPCMVVFAANVTASDAERGKSQGGLIHLDAETTDGSTVNMASRTTEIAVLTNATISYTGTVSAWNETDGTASGWLVSGTISNPAGTPALAGNVATALASSSGAALVVSAVASTTDLLRFAVTGVADKVIRYSAALIISRATT